jgi:diadenosine tetraphosphate (Ap4A) HIT family hydrolase
MPNPIFQDESHYREVFSRGLDKLLDSDQLGAYILVLANSIYDPHIHAVLADKLQKRFVELSEQLRHTLIQGCPLQQAEDDIPVFLKLMAIGLNNLQPTQFRQAGSWEIQFNHLRAFRPARMSNEVISSLHADFSRQGFHFNKPFLQKETIWEGDLLDSHCRLLYNKFPFAPLHGLLVMEPHSNHPQYLLKEVHEHHWQLLEQLGRTLPDCGLGYNARGACSSVNHLHMQMYAGKTGGYPVEQEYWAHNGGNQKYPLPVNCFQSASSAWQLVEQLHQEQHSYNLLYRPGKLYVIQRAMQGRYSQTEGLSGFAWAESCGAVTVFSRDRFMQLQETDISQSLAQLQP